MHALPRRPVRRPRLRHRSCAAAALGRIRLEAGRTLTGTVTDDSGQPIRGATIRLNHDPATPSFVAITEGYRILPLREVTTDDGGRFALSGLSDEDGVHLWIAAEGFLGVPHTVSRSDDNVVLALERGAVVDVLAVGPLGVPLEGAEVRIQPLGKAESFVSMITIPGTDTHGRYSSRALPAGPLEVTVSAPGYNSDRRVVDVAAGHRRLARFELEAVASSSVTVEVVREDDTPLAGAMVSLAARQHSSSAVYLHELADATGSVVWPVVPHGTFDLAVRPPEDEPFDDYRAEEPLEVSTEDLVQRVVLQPRPGGPALGRVLDHAGRPVSSARVSIEYGQYRAVTDADGRFALPRAPWGEHEVTVHQTSGVAVPVGVHEVSPDGESWDLWLPQLTPVTVSVSPGPGVNREGSWKVVARQQSGTWAPTLRRGELVFEILPVPPGVWTLKASKGRALAEIEVEVPGDGTPMEVEIEVRAPETGFLVTGIISGPEGVLAQARIGLSALNDPRLRFKAETDSAGRYVLADVPAGRYQITITGLSQPLLSRTVEIDGDIDLSFELGFAWIRGRVAADEWDPSQTSVRLDPMGPADPELGWSYSTHSYLEWVRPRPDGTFEAGPLEEGRWRVSFHRDGYQPWEKVVVIDGEDVDDLVIRLERGGSHLLEPGLYEIEVTAADGRVWIDTAEVRDQETTEIVLDQP